MSPSNPKLNNGDTQLIEEFIKDLEVTSDQVQKLLDTVRASELDFATIKIELRILCENVKDISSLLRDGDGRNSLVTRIVLLEQKIKELEKDFERDIDKREEVDKNARKSLTEVVLADKHGKWQMRIALVTGIIGLLTSVISTIATHVK